MNRITIGVLSLSFLACGGDICASFADNEAEREACYEQKETDSGVSDSCPDELNGQWLSQTSSSVVFDVEDPGSATMYCLMESFQIEIAIAGPGDEGHALGTFDGSGDIYNYNKAGSPPDVYAEDYGDRIYPKAHMYVLGETSTSGDVEIQVSADLPDQWNDSTQKATLTGEIDSSNPDLMTLEFDVDPTNNGSSDSEGCRSFYFGTMTFMRTSGTEGGDAGAVSAWNLEADSDDEQLEDCDEGGDTSANDTGTDASEAETSSDDSPYEGLRAMPDGFDNVGILPDSTYRAWASMYSTLSLSPTPEAWRDQAHRMVGTQFAPGTNGSPPPIYKLLETVKGVLDPMAVQDGAHALIDWLYAHPEDRALLLIICNDYVAGRIGTGEFEWYAGNLAMRSNAGAIAVSGTASRQQQ